MNKVNVGCGVRILPGYINVDVQSIEGAIQADMRALPFARESVDLLYCSHVLEHMGRHEWRVVLSRWHDLIVPGGRIRLAVPDFDAVVERYCQTKNLMELLGLLYGGQRNEYDYHVMAFTFDTLAAGLLDVGFVNVRRYDWRKTDTADFDDYSKAYLPHMDQSGRLMSLNVEATRP